MLYLMIPHNIILNCLLLKSYIFGGPGPVRSPYLSRLYMYNPGRLTWNLRIHPWKRNIIFQTVTIIFQVQAVNLQECNPYQKQNINFTWGCFISFLKPFTSPKNTQTPRHRASEHVCGTRRGTCRSLAKGEHHVGWWVGKRNPGIV